MRCRTAYCSWLYFYFDPVSLKAVPYRHLTVNIASNCVCHWMCMNIECLNWTFIATGASCCSTEFIEMSILHFPPSVQRCQCFILIVNAVWKCVSIHDSKPSSPTGHAVHTPACISTQWHTFRVFINSFQIALNITGILLSNTLNVSVCQHFLPVTGVAHGCKGEIGLKERKKVREWVKREKDDDVQRKEKCV